MESTELIAGMLKGDERAFTAFFDSYFPRVYRFALPRLGGDADATAEVVQATLVKAMRKLGDYRGEAHAKLTEALEAMEKHIAARKGKLTDFPPRPVS